MPPAHSLKVLAVLWAAALPACFAGPTLAKWQYHLSEAGTLAVGGTAEYGGFFSRDCQVGWVAGRSYGCFDSAEKDNDFVVVSAAVSDPTVLTARVDGKRVLVDALREGSAKLEVKARRRGDVRTESVTIYVKRPTQVGAVRKPSAPGERAGCLPGRMPAKLWFPVGESFSLWYWLEAGDAHLVGLPITTTATGTPGFREVSRAEEFNAYRLEATYVMSEPGTFTVSAAGFPAVVSGGGYTCRTVTGIRLGYASRRITVVYMVGDEPVCSDPMTPCPITFVAETPEVCTVAEGPVIQEVGKGTCRISATLDGTPHRATLQTRL